MKGDEDITFSVALLQIFPTEISPEFNLEKGIDACRKAKALGADLALFPEMWHIGYAFCPPDKKGEWEAKAIDQQSDFFQAYTHVAKELGLNIALTYLERHSPKPRHTVSVINSMGKVVLTYAKVFLCNFGQEELHKEQYQLDDVGRDYNYSPGTTFDVCELTTGEGAVKVGAMICADREFPEAAGALMKNGAELIIVPNSCEWDEIRDCQLNTRAFENLVGIAMANYPKPRIMASLPLILLWLLRITRCWSRQKRVKKSLWRLLIWIRLESLEGTKLPFSPPKLLYALSPIGQLVRC